ncbi:MAG: radical SAM protein [Nanobdellota archaeon]
MDRLLEEADRVYRENFSNETYFERAIFISWHCDRGDCKFCYMSTQNTSRLSRRKASSIYAEAAICRAYDWPIGFLSGGYGAYDHDQILGLIKNIYSITGRKQWLNIGLIPKEKLREFRPYIEGVTGSVETVNKELHDELCPSKPLEPIEEMFENLDELGLKKAMTIIIGLGETREDFEEYRNFIERYKVDKVVIYALNPIKGTIFTEGPAIEDFLWWIAKTRIAFPKIHIVAGVWTSRLDYLERILKAGPNNITKFPVWRVMSTGKADRIYEAMENMGRKFRSVLRNPPEIDFSQYDEETAHKMHKYVDKFYK